LFERAADEKQQVLRVDRLRQKVERPFLHRTDRIFEGAKRRHDDDRDLLVQLFRGTQDGEAVPFGKSQIGEYECWLRVLQRLGRFCRVTCLYDVVPIAFERMTEHRAQRILVFDDENAGGCGHST
jgi:hypothetical protein